jgi:hypothetical protein
MIRSITAFTFAVAWLLLLDAAPRAQGTAQLNGRVTDESGGVLPGVTVTATQTNTGFIRSTVTDETGNWLMPNLPIGPYRLEAALQGFRSFVQTGVVLQVGANPTIATTLAVGSLEESVTVEAAAPLVDVRSAGISDVVEQERIVELPLQGRQVTDLIVLAGSAVDTGRVTSLGIAQSVAISVAGGLRNGVGYTLDGALHNTSYDNANLPFPFPDALQEFRVATSGLTADNGMHSGASVNAVTKSGTNAFHGNAFEFLRDRRFNASSAFAPLGPDGEKLDDGLNRNQFGGTLGGPIVRDRLFFFGGYQRTRLREVPPDRLAHIPTAAMLAGDFTAVTSPACNGGRQINLRAPFVNNRIDPALFSRPAVNIATSGWIPSTNDPCGEIRFSVPVNFNDEQYVTRIDYQLGGNHSIFGRYMNTYERTRSALLKTHNLLTQTGTPNLGRRAQAAAFGDTQVFGANVVNSFRSTWVLTSTNSNIPPEQFFDAAAVGIDVYSYVPGVSNVTITNGFSYSGGPGTGALADNTTWQAQDDFSRVMGRHQVSMGANVSHSDLDQTNYALAIGLFSFNGRATGLGLADFFTGQVSNFRHAAPGILRNKQWYVGAYGQDTWRASDRVTLNLGLRWEPYFGTSFQDQTVSNFILDNFHNGIKSTRYVNAPAGLVYPGDPDFPPGNSGMKTQWWNLSPRVGLAWDVSGDGRLAVRSSYGINYDFPGAVFQYVAVGAAPWGNRIDLAGNLPFENPYRDVPGGQPHPVQGAPPRDVEFPGFGSYATIDPDINSTRVQSWNVTLERQLGASWQVSASYLGSYTDRLWGIVQLNPGVFLGLGPCTLDGIVYRTCSTTANLEQRRALTLENPEEGRLLSYVQRYDDVGEQTYRGLKFSFRRRAAEGVSLTGNYTLSNCKTDTYVSGSFNQFSAGYTNPADPAYDRGNCQQNRRQIANFTVGYFTPQLASSVLRAVASDWRISGILNARSGEWLTVTTGRDPALNGIPGQRVDQVLDVPYARTKSLETYLDRAAFAYPAAGTFGNEPNNAIEGPAFWGVDLSLARLLPIGAQTLELRAEAFNLFNNFNWGNPGTNFDSGTFGRVTSQAGSPRIMQFAVKYAF